MMIETDFARLERIKSAIGVEKSSRKGQSQALHRAKGVLEMRLEVESVMMVACDDPARSDDVALSIRDRQNIRRFRPFSVLVSDTLAAFLRQRMAAVEIQLRQIEVILDRLDTLLPDPLQTAIGAPFLKVIIDRLPAKFFFSGSFREGASGNCVH